MKKKPIFTILITFIIIIIAYFIAWKVIATKTKNRIEKKIIESGIIYKDLSISGFPFSKKLKISNLEFKNNTEGLTKDALKINKVILSSFIFGNDYTASFKNIKIFNASKNEENTIKFNSIPIAKFSFYKNGELKSFTYKDTDYEIIDSKNKKVNSAGLSSIKINSILTDNTSDYSIIASFNELKNFNILDKKFTNNDSKLIPNSYNVKIDVSLYLKKEGDKIVETSLKINDISFDNKVTNIEISLNGEVKNDKEDSMLFGKLKLQINNFDKFSLFLFETFKETQIKNETPENKIIKSKLFLDNIEEFKILSKKNKETTDKKAVFLIERKKKEIDYKINEESLLSFISEQNRKNQDRLKKETEKNQESKIEESMEVEEEKTETKEGVKTEEKK